MSEETGAAVISPSETLPPPVYDSSKLPNPVLAEMKALWDHRLLIKLMIQRNLLLKYRRSLLGVFWSVMEPLGTMVVMAVVFRFILIRAIPFYPIYLLSGLLMWNFFGSSTSQAQTDLFQGNNLTERVYVPKFSFVLASVASNWINALITTVLVIILSLFYGTPFNLNIFWLIPALILGFFFNLGVASVAATANIFFTDVKQIWPILMRLGLYLSAIFYEVDTFSHRMQVLFNLNPVYHYILMARSAVYYGAPPPQVTILLCVGLAVFSSVVGFVFFCHQSKKFIYYV